MVSTMSLILKCSCVEENKIDYSFSIFQVGSLKRYYHFKHEGKGLRHKRHIHEKTRLLLSENEVRPFFNSPAILYLRVYVLT